MNERQRITDKQKNLLKALEFGGSLLLVDGEWRLVTLGDGGEPVDARTLRSLARRGLLVVGETRAVLPRSGE